MEEKLKLLKLIADETRIEILNILMREDSYVEKIACELSLTPATICYHLKKMEGKLDIQLQSQLSELGQMPGAGHLPFSPEQLLLESQLHLSLLNDKLDYQLS